MMRRIVFEGREIVFELERKNVKNINLRVHGDGSVYVSANRSVSAGRVDGFVLSKAAVILSTQERLTEAARRRLEHTQYADGECLGFLRTVLLNGNAEHCKGQEKREKFRLLSFFLPFFFLSVHSSF